MELESELSVLREQCDPAEYQRMQKGQLGGGKASLCEVAFSLIYDFSLREMEKMCLYLHPPNYYIPPHLMCIMQSLSVQWRRSMR